MKYQLLMSMQYHRGILIDRIPVSGLPGLLFVAATLVAILGTPVALQFFMATGTAGVCGAGALYWWHNQTRW